MSNRDANIAICEWLRNKIDEYPDDGFQKILQETNLIQRNGDYLIDRYFESSEDTLKRTVA